MDFNVKLTGLIAVTLLVLLMRPSSARTAATEIQVRTDTPGFVRLVCEEDHNTVTNAIWQRGEKEGLTVDDFVSIVELGNGEIRFSGTLLQSSLWPGDEGNYSCRAGPASSGTTFGLKKAFEVHPYVQEKYRNMTHERGTNLTIPCGVLIGDVSRQKGYRVQWDKLRKDDTIVYTAITYRSGSEDSLVSADKLHVLNLTDFSLQVFNHSQDDLVYQCTVTTATHSHAGDAKTAISLECDHPRIFRPLPEVVVTRPEGELIVNFTFTSSPMPVVRWRLDDRILKVTSIPGSKRTFTEKLELAEEQGGLLTATVEMCGVSVSTETKLIVVANVEEPRLIQEDKCDTPALSFFLPQSLPELAAELDVELLVRFTEVRKKGKMKIMSYRAAEIVGKSNVTGFKLTQLPDLTDVKKYRIEVMLSVNGTMSSNWSSAEGTLAAIQHCPPIETTELQLFLTFEEACDEEKEGDFGEAIEDSFEGWCEGLEWGCGGNLEFKKDTATLQCDSTREQKGTFTVTFESRAARNLANEYYAYLEGKGGDQVEVRGQAVTVHGSTDSVEPSGEGKKENLHMFYAVVGGMVVLVLIVVMLVVMVIKYKRKQPGPVKHTPASPPGVVETQPSPEPPGPSQPATPPPPSQSPTLVSLGTVSDILARYLPGTELDPQPSPTPPPHTPVDTRNTPPPSPPPRVIIIYASPRPSPPPSRDHTPPPSFHSTPPASPPPSVYTESSAQDVEIDIDQFRSPCSHCEWCRRNYSSNPELQRHPVPSLLGQLRMQQPQAQEQASQSSRNLWSQNCTRHHQSCDRQRHHSDTCTAPADPRCHALQYSELAPDHQQGAYLQTVPSPVPSAFVPVPRSDVPSYVGGDRPRSVPPNAHRQRNVNSSVYRHPLCRSSVASCSSVASAPVCGPSQSGHGRVPDPKICSSNPPSRLPTKPPFERMRSLSCSDAEPCTVKASCARRLPEISPHSEHLLKTLEYEDSQDYWTGLWLMRMPSYVAGGDDQQGTEDEKAEEETDL